MNQIILDFINRSFFAIIYGIALVVSIKTYRNYFDTVFKYLPLIIAYTLLNEILGFFIRNYPEYSFFNDIKYSRFNDIIYNLYDLVFFPYFYYIYWKLASKRIYKVSIVLTSSFAILSYLVSSFYQNPMDTMLYYAYFIASTVLIFCILLNSIEKRENNIPITNQYNLVFWINLSLVIFYSISPFLLIIGYTQIEIWEQFNLRLILRILIVIMYSLIIFGLLRSRRRQFR